MKNETKAIVETMQNLNIFAECEDCHNKFNVNNKNLTQKEFTANGQSIFLTYYDCPSCNRRHFVQIDNGMSKVKLKVCKNQMAKFTAAKSKGKLTRKQSDNFKKARKDLSDYRTNLMKKFTGVTCYDEETKSTFELRFSV